MLFRSTCTEHYENIHARGDEASKVESIFDFTNDAAMFGLLTVLNEAISVPSCGPWDTLTVAAAAGTQLSVSQTRTQGGACVGRF